MPEVSLAEKRVSSRRMGPGVRKKSRRNDRDGAGAILYVRVSTEEQTREGVSIAAQEERLKNYCASLGLTVVKTVKEEGISAAKPLSSRPGGQELLSLIEKGEGRCVVALKLDRLFRDSIDCLVQTKAWDEAGVALHLVDLGGQTLNTASAMGRFFLSMMAGVAELERNLIRERIAMAINFKKARGEVYGTTPYGFDRESGLLKENPRERRIVSLMFSLKEQGLSYRRIADRLNSAGIKSKRGGKWYASSVRYVLKNSLYGELNSAIDLRLSRS